MVDFVLVRYPSLHHQRQAFAVAVELRRIHALNLRHAGLIAGLKKLEADGWNLILNAEQKARVENLILESNNLMPFMQDCLQKDDKHSITVSEAYAVYTGYCEKRDWMALARYEFGSQIEKAVATQFGVAMRNDIKDTNQKAQRGWKGVGLQ